MNDSVYRFRLTRYDPQELLPQVSRALEARTRHLSSQKYPVLWRFTNKLNTCDKNKKSSFQKILSIYLIAVGLFLFIPGLMRPATLQVPLIAGGFSILLGIRYLRYNRQPKNNRVMEKQFDQAAKRLLADTDLTEDQAACVTFDVEGMTVSSAQQPEDQVHFGRFDSAVEGADILLLFWDDRVLLLQKKDLVQNSADGLSALLREKIPTYLTLD